MEQKNTSSQYLLYKKIAFFWILFHLIGYISFLTDVHPSFKYTTNEKNYNSYYMSEKQINHYFYFITPNKYHYKYSDRQRLYPFQDFTDKDYDSEAFIGFWGYYRHLEFCVYIILPLVIMLLVVFYKKVIVK